MSHSSDKDAENIFNQTLADSNCELNKESKTGADDEECEIILAILPLKKATSDQTFNELSATDIFRGNSFHDSREGSISQSRINIFYDLDKPKIPAIYHRTKIVSSHVQVDTSKAVETEITTRSIRVGESNSKHKTTVRTSSKQKREMSNNPHMLFRPEKFKTFTKPQDYTPIPPIHRLPDYPKIGFPQKWGVPVLPAESRSVQVGLSCPPAPLFPNEQLMTHSASTLRKYYNDSNCAVAKDWVKVQSRL